MRCTPIVSVSAGCNAPGDNEASCTACHRIAVNNHEKITRARAEFGTGLGFANIATAETQTAGGDVKTNPTKTVGYTYMPNASTFITGRPAVIATYLGATASGTPPPRRSLWRRLLRKD